MVVLVDHMWQTLQVFACLALFAFLTRHNSARFRIWVWRVAALKLVLPMQVLYLLGHWVGFPVSHSADPPPAALVQLASDLKPWVAPAAHLDVRERWALLAALAAGIVGALWRIRRGLRVEGPRATDELRRLERDPDDHPRGVGLLNAALMTAWALLLITGPAMSGAIDDRLRRQRLLQRNEQQLRDAAVEIRPAARGMGSRYRITVDDSGVTIRNASLREIGGIAYGVSVYLVRGQHFAKEGEVDWLTGTRHDVRISGSIIEPEQFDTYALREPLTRALATQFGLEIYDKGKCVPPCGRWGSYVLPASALAAIESRAAAISSPAPEAVSPPSTRERFAAYLQALNSGDRATLAEFHDRHLTARSQTAMSVDQELILQRQTGGFVVLEFNDPRPRMANGWLKARDSDALMSFDFQIEPVDPFRISHRSIAWGSPPKHYLPRRLSEAETITAVRAQVHRLVSEEKFSGALLVARRHNVLLRQAHGFANREEGVPNTIDTRFRVASVTKMFTAVAVLRLAQDGRIRLDDPIGKWVPEIAGKPIAGATIHQLLTHTSGAGDIFGPAYAERHRELRTHGDYVRLGADLKLQFRPGSRHLYSNFGYLLLGRMIETASGRSWHDFVRDNVFVPARMTRSGTEPEEAPVERSRIYEKPLGMHEYVPADYVLDYRASAYGHAYSTVDDLASFIRALREHRLLDRKYTTLLLTPRVEVGKGFRYGYGSMHMDMEWTGHWIGHSGSYTAMNAELWFSPDTDHIVVVLANIDPPAARNVSGFITARLPLN